MRVWLLAAASALGMAGSPQAGPIDALAEDVAGDFTSFYVLGDSLSDDGNLPGPLWFFATGGAPYAGDFFGGGVFSDGEVWNEPIAEAFREAGRDAENFAVAGSQAVGGGFLPNLDQQIDTLLRDTSPQDRGANPLVSIWSGANDVLDATGSGDARAAARAAADEVAAGARRLFDAAGVDDFVVFNLPNLARIPKFNLFERDLRREARRATRVYNRRLAGRLAQLEADALAVYEVDTFDLIEDARRDPAAFGLADIRLPCVFPSQEEADAFDRPVRCDAATAEGLLFVDDLHPTATAHEALAERAAGAILDGGGAISMVASVSAAAPAPVPVPGGAWTLASALAGLMAAGGLARRRR